MKCVLSFDKSFKLDIFPKPYYSLKPQIIQKALTKKNIISGYN